MPARKTTTKVATEATQEKAVKSTAKKFANDDMIECRSITNGELIMRGEKTGTIYKWADYGEVGEVEYQDLLYDVRSSSVGFSMSPRFIVLDNDFLSQNKKLSDLYNSMYTTTDLRGILLNAPIDQFEKIINSMPDGAKEAIKGLASTMIDNGSLDSVKKIKIIDSIFNTELLLALTDN